MFSALDLPLIWAAILALAVFMYILLDGFDLGVGILFPFASSGQQRNQMMASVAPLWDGNETWLVLGGAGLFAVFPQAYATMMPALYMPIGFMLTALIFRGVAFEFRPRAAQGTGQRLWDLAFHWGSLVATFSQGLILGTLIQGIQIENGQFAGSMFDWLTPFSFIVGWGLVWGYALLGSCWLIIKTEHQLQAWSRRTALMAALMVMLMLIIISIWMISFDLTVAQRWGLALPDFDLKQALLMSPVPLLVAGCFVGLVRGLKNESTYAPYLYAIGIFTLAYTGLLLGIWPYLVPYSITVYQAAAAPESQAFVLIGTLLLLPMILGYTLFVYWTFRGKVRDEDGYH